MYCNFHVFRSGDWISYAKSRMLNRSCLLSDVWPIAIYRSIKLYRTRRALGRAHVPLTKLFQRLAVNKTIVKPCVAAAQYL